MASKTPVFTTDCEYETYLSGGVANTGSGGAGGGKGGSGVVILRGDQDDLLPVEFDGVTLQKILSNGEEVSHLIHDGTQVFMERLRRMFGWLKQETRLLQRAH